MRSLTVVAEEHRVVMGHQTAAIEPTFPSAPQKWAENGKRSSWQFVLKGESYIVQI